MTTNRGHVAYLLAGCVLIACSEDAPTSRACAPTDAACLAMQAGALGTAGLGAAGAAGGGAGTGAAGSGGAGVDGLMVHVEDGEAMKIEIVTLKCIGDCADVKAVATGGHAPYTFEWEDGTATATRHVCLDESSKLTVSATDTPTGSDEFGLAAQTVTAEVDATVLTCDDPGSPCVKHATAGSFDPVLKWSWKSSSGSSSSLSTPLVANLTDDNGDGSVNLKDTPDIVLVSYGESSIVVLDGGKGTEHYRIAEVNYESTPALGDIDGDKQTDIVAVMSDYSLAAFSGRDGVQKWRKAADTLPWREAIPVSLADLDHDGKVEIIADVRVFDAQGVMIWEAPAQDVSSYSSPTAVDLDGDGFMEVVWGGLAMKHDGTPYYRNEQVLVPPVDLGLAFTGQYTAIADLDANGTPEVVVSTTHGLFVLDHKGKTLRSVVPEHVHGLPFPPAIHDLDGDGKPEILVSDGLAFKAYEADLSVQWSMPVADTSGIAAGTAFDFLGDGTAEAMYGDETTSWGFDGKDGHVIFMQPRSSGTVIEYPSVADVDNDGSADILIVSDTGSAELPTLQVVSDRMARWIPARRILNQDTYHVTNIEEDGTIPLHETPHWQLNNSFRAQAQINASGVVCLPNPD